MKSNVIVDDKHVTKMLKKDSFNLFFYYQCITDKINIGSLICYVYDFN